MVLLTCCVTILYLWLTIYEYFTRILSIIWKKIFVIQSNWPSFLKDRTRYANRIEVASFLKIQVTVTYILFLRILLLLVLDIYIELVMDTLIRGDVWTKSCTVFGFTEGCGGSYSQEWCQPLIAPPPSHVKHHFSYHYKWHTHSWRNPRNCIQGGDIGLLLYVTNDMGCKWLGMLTTNDTGC